MPLPPRKSDPVSVTVDHDEDIHRLKLAQQSKPAAKRVFSRLADLLDVRMTYKPTGDAPPIGTTLGYGYAQGSKHPHEGAWQALGGPPVAIDGTGDFAVSGTGNLTISERLVPTGWDDTQWVRVWATVVAGGSDLPNTVNLSPDEVDVGIKTGTTWTDTEVEVGGVGTEIEFIDEPGVTLQPASALGLYESFPALTLILTDESGPTANYADAYTATCGPGGRRSLSVSWLYSGGIPLVQASLTNLGAYPASHTLTVLVRYEPVPYRPAP